MKEIFQEAIFDSFLSENGVKPLSQQFFTEIFMYLACFHVVQMSQIYVFSFVIVAKKISQLKLFFIVKRIIIISLKVLKKILRRIFFFLDFFALLYLLNIFYLSIYHPHKSSISASIFFCFSCPYNKLLNMNISFYICNRKIYQKKD